MRKSARVGDFVNWNVVDNVEAHLIQASIKGAKIRVLNNY